MQIHYVTSNNEKFEEAQAIFKDWTLRRVDLDITEIQGDPLEVIRDKAQKAQSAVNAPLIVEDVSAYAEGLGGFPGPYVKDFMRCLGEERAAQIILSTANPKIRIYCHMAYSLPGEEPLIVSGFIDGKICLPRGTTRYGTYSWNAIFLPDGYDETFGEMSIETQSKISHRRRAMEKIKETLQPL